MIFLMRVGCISTPPFAIAAESSAICSGVTRSSLWPNGGQHEVGSILPGRVDARGDVEVAVRERERLAESESGRVLGDGASPMDAPSCAIGMLQLRPNGRRDRRGRPRPAGLVGRVVDERRSRRGSCSAAGFGNAVSGVALPLSSAAAATTNLKTEPGWYRSPAVARLVSGLLGDSAVRCMPRRTGTCCEPRGYSGRTRASTPWPGLRPSSGRSRRPRRSCCRAHPMPPAAPWGRL